MVQLYNEITIKRWDESKTLTQLFNYNCDKCNKVQAQGVRRSFKKSEVSAGGLNRI